MTATPFPNNQIPSSLLNAGAAATLKLLPQPNIGAPGAQAANYLFIASQPFNSDQYDIRLDHQISSKNTLFGRYSRALQTNVNPGNFAGFIGGGTNNINNSIHTILNDTHVFSPNVVNEARAGYSRHNGSFEVAGISEGLDFANKNGIAVYPFPVLLFPNIVFSPSGLTSGSQTLYEARLGRAESEHREHFSGIRQPDVEPWPRTPSRWARRCAGGASTWYSARDRRCSDRSSVRLPTIPGSGSPLADFLLGYPAQLTGTQLPDWARMRDLYFGTYLQDDWRISPKLTLNLGLRYELFTQPVDARDRGSLFDARSGKFVVPGQPGLHAGDRGRPSAEPRAALRFRLQRVAKVDGARRHRDLLRPTLAEPADHRVRIESAQRADRDHTFGEREHHGHTADHDQHSDSAWARPAPTSARSRRRIRSGC